MMGHTKYKMLYLFVLIPLFLISCEKSSLEEIIIVNSEYVKAVDPVSLIERNYMQIRNIEDGSDNWEIVEYIEGFEYEEGYEYTLKVKTIKYKKPEIDMSDTKYKLIEVLSKSKKPIAE